MSQRVSDRRLQGVPVPRWMTGIPVIRGIGVRLGRVPVGVNGRYWHLEMLPQHSTRSGLPPDPPSWTEYAERADVLRRPPGSGDKSFTGNRTPEPR